MKIILYNNHSENNGIMRCVHRNANTNNIMVHFANFK